jgi:hypothetical protein
MTTPDTLTDWRGNTYTIGDRVLYPRTSGRSCEIQEGRITKINRREDGQVKSISIMPFRSSRFGYGPSTAVSITIISNITRVMEPENVIVLPTIDATNIEQHIKDDHGDKINHVLKQMGERYPNAEGYHRKDWYRHLAPQEQVDEYFALLVEFHADLHQHELNGLSHVHDHSTRTHEWELRVERYETRKRFAAWQHKINGTRLTEPPPGQSKWSFEYTTPDAARRGYDRYSDWEKVYEDYQHAIEATYCSHCDVKMAPNDHRNASNPQGMICTNNSPNNEESE